ncbi:hypothetical protein [Phycicoccus sp. Soil802]|uniref:hypothetical protein n=1 Tax=Phycicoccus sp. Soil802 TaxID=1736414 RepID=UPI0012FCFB20|nr:hypothetical protein [Phycicoccus sp. Soil802]
MNKDLRRETAMLGLILVVALVSPLFFDLSPLNWISVLFVAWYVVQRGVRAARRRATRSSPS